MTKWGVPDQAIPGVGSAPWFTAKDHMWLRSCSYLTSRALGKIWVLLESFCIGCETDLDSITIAWIMSLSFAQKPNMGSFNEIHDCMNSRG